MIERNFLLTSRRKISIMKTYLKDVRIIKNCYFCTDSHDDNNGDEEIIYL